VRRDIQQKIQRPQPERQTLDSRINADLLEKLEKLRRGK
jgi:predicted  nucleic acid-binding Zn-ribbon protein